MTELYNAFISYAWRDNETIDNSGKGWVSTFVDRLGKLLIRELPREISRHGIWLDYEQMRGNDNISDKIREKLEASRLLVPIISKSYLNSPWCRQELEIFIKKHGPDSGRIFPVWMEPVENMPKELNDLLKYDFWYEDDKKQPRTRWFPDIDPTDREYGNIQQDMARDMAACLKKIAAAEQNSTHSGQVRPVSQPSTNPLGDRIVLVNGGEDDKELIQQVVDCLGSQYRIGAFSPVSALQNANNLKSSEINSDLREKLKVCTAVLIVYRNGPEHQIHGHITEYLKCLPKRPKNNPLPTMDICHPAHIVPPAGISFPQIKVHSCSANCAADCVKKFTRERKMS